MPHLFVSSAGFRRTLLATLALAVGSCARSHYFQSDARIGPGSASALPANADSVLATAGRQYNRHGGIYRFFLGRHYRHVWAAPVRAAVLNLATAVPGGLTAGKSGGGFQSISMTLNGRQQRGYALRALDKEPYKTLPLLLRHTFLLNVVRDATSATIPYGALTVPPLAAAAGVPHACPRLVYVRPDESGLGPSGEQFRGKLALLEGKYNAPASDTLDLRGATDFLNGEKMLRNVYRHPAYAIDQTAFLRARLLDIWLGDWDRHEAQWSWAEFSAPGGRVRYQAIPKDRDQVYFRFDDGVIPWLAARPFIAPQFQTFRNGYNNMAGLVYQARFIDQRGLCAMTRTDFQRTARDLQRHLPDSVIDRALHRLPPAVFALEGARLGKALRCRRATLPQAAEAFYRTLTRRPDLGGTARHERFVVRRYPDSTTVRVFSATLGQLTPGDSLRFQRTYFNAETQVLTLYGLGGDDVFEVTTMGPGRPLRLCLYGGQGRDQLRLQGPARRLQRFDDASDLLITTERHPSLPRKKHRPYDRLNDD